MTGHYYRATNTFLPSSLGFLLCRPTLLHCPTFWGKSNHFPQHARHIVFSGLKRRRGLWVLIQVMDNCTFTSFLASLKNQTYGGCPSVFSPVCLVSSFIMRYNSSKVQLKKYRCSLISSTFQSNAKFVGVNHWTIYIKIKNIILQTSKKKLDRP